MSVAVATSGALELRSVVELVDWLVSTDFFESVEQPPTSYYVLKTWLLWILWYNHIFETLLKKNLVYKIQNRIKNMVVPSYYDMLKQDHNQY